MTFSEHLQNWILPYIVLELNCFDHLKQNLNVTKFQKKTRREISNQ